MADAVKNWTAYMLKQLSCGYRFVKVFMLLELEIKRIEQLCKLFDPTAWYLSVGLITDEKIGSVCVAVPEIYVKEFHDVTKRSEQFEFRTEQNLARYFNIAGAVIKFHDYDGYVGFVITQASDRLPAYHAERETRKVLQAIDNDFGVIPTVVGGDTNTYTSPQADKNS